MDREIALLAAARKMDGDALAQIFDLYAPALYKYAFRLCENAGVADRFVGDVFERFVQGISAGQNPGINLRVYLYEVAHSILDRDVRYTSCFLPTHRPLRKYPNWRSIEFGEDEQRLYDALQQALLYNLTVDQRHVVILRFMEGFSLKETAAIIGKKINHVKVLQNRGIAALRKTFEDQAVETTRIAFFLRRMAQA